MSKHHEGQLSQFQIDVAGVFFSLPESVGFLLAGGGALIAQGLVRRETDDLDFFANRDHGDVASAGDALIAAVEGRGWQIDVARSGPEFRRFKISRPVAAPDEPDDVYADLAVDSPPSRAPIVTIAGPALAPYELAVRKTLALFGRAEARDFTDVHALHQRFDRGEILKDVAQADQGFDLEIFAQMLRSHSRLRDDDFPDSELTVSELRAYFDEWATELS
ncbi:MAG: nucleotidyl transferase AbiEii/AbiGii toxin family protein [Aeromicrobium sp.]